MSPTKRQTNLGIITVNYNKFKMSEIDHKKKSLNFRLRNSESLPRD